MAMLMLSPRYRELLAFSFSLRSPLEALLHNLIALPTSLTLWFRPWALSAEHELSYSVPALWSCAALVAAIVTIAIWQREERPFITLALLWPPLAMLLSHSFIAKLDPITEAPLYLAWIGPCVAFGDWLARRAYDWNSIHFKPVATTICILAIGLCEWRVSVWRDSVELWSEATVSAPESSRAWANLGVAQLSQGRIDAARTALTQARNLDPNNMQATFNLEIVAALAATSGSRYVP
jgi:hypothetical protein